MIEEFFTPNMLKALEPRIKPALLALLRPGTQNGELNHLRITDWEIDTLILKTRLPSSPDSEVQATLVRVVYEIVD